MKKNKEAKMQFLYFFALMPQRRHLVGYKVGREKWPEFDVCLEPKEKSNLKRMSATVSSFSFILMVRQLPIYFAFNPLPLTGRCLSAACLTKQDCIRSDCRHRPVCAGATFSTKWAIPVLTVEAFSFTRHSFLSENKQEKVVVMFIMQCDLRH